MENSENERVMIDIAIFNICGCLRELESNLQMTEYYDELQSIFFPIYIRAERGSLTEDDIKTLKAVEKAFVAYKKALLYIHEYNEALNDLGIKGMTLEMSERKGQI